MHVSIYRYINLLHIGLVTWGCASCGYWKEKVSDRNKKKYNIEETNDHTEENIELNTAVIKIYQTWK